MNPFIKRNRPPTPAHEFRKGDYIHCYRTDGLPACGATLIITGIGPNTIVCAPYAFDITTGLPLAHRSQEFYIRPTEPPVIRRDALY